MKLTSQMASSTSLMPSRSTASAWRVAIGRALVRRPAIYLMDEPLCSLDAKLFAVMAQPPGPQSFDPEIDEF